MHDSHLVNAVGIGDAYRVTRTRIGFSACGRSSAGSSAAQWRLCSTSTCFLPLKSPHFFHTPQTPCHHRLAPVTGWIAYVSVQAGGRPPGDCRNVRQDDGGGGAPAGSAGSRISLYGLIGQASHRRSPRPLGRPAPAGCQGWGGNGPVAGRLADAGRVSGALSAALAFPHCQRKAQPVPDEAGCRFELPVSGRRMMACDRLSDADTIRRYSGPRADCATPHVSAKARHAHHTHTPNGTACARPSGLSIAKLRRRGARRVSACTNLSAKSKCRIRR